VDRQPLLPISAFVTHIRISSDELPTHHSPGLVDFSRHPVKKSALTRLLFRSEVVYLSGGVQVPPLDGLQHSFETSQLLSLDLANTHPDLAVYPLHTQSPSTANSVPVTGEDDAFAFICHLEEKVSRLEHELADLRSQLVKPGADDQSDQIDSRHSSRSNSKRECSLPSETGQETAPISSSSGVLVPNRKRRKCVRRPKVSEPFGLEAVFITDCDVLKGGQERSCQTSDRLCHICKW
jgi:hypothetical protein